MNDLIQIFEEKIKSADNLQKLYDTRNIFLKEYITPLYSRLKNAENEEKKQLGKSINDVKVKIDEIFETTMNAFKTQSEAKNHNVDYDISINSTNLSKGSLSPITLMMNEIGEY
jgi:phenylalanyl-tRNA synthetase alpha subunit